MISISTLIHEIQIIKIVSPGNEFEKKINIRDYKIRILRAEYAQSTIENCKFFDNFLELSMLVDEKQFSYNSIYSIFEIKLKILRIYLNKYLANKYIRLFKLFANISILFMRKKNDSLRLYINYKGFNIIIIKNRYFLLFIEKSLNRLNRAKRFTNLNLTTIYYRIRIKRDNE